MSQLPPLTSMQAHYAALVQLALLLSLYHHHSFCHLYSITEKLKGGDLAGLDSKNDFAQCLAQNRKQKQITTKKEGREGKGIHNQPPRTNRRKAQLLSRCPFISWSARASQILLFLWSTLFSALLLPAKLSTFCRTYFHGDPPHVLLFSSSPLMHDSLPMAAVYLRGTSSLWFIFQLPSGRVCGPAAHLYIHWAVLSSPQPPDRCRWQSHFS